jgi:hypothetical protein
MVDSNTISGINCGGPFDMRSGWNPTRFDRFLDCLSAGPAVAAALAIAFSVSPSHAAQHRLPSGYKWGRCLLVVQGETRISGKCSYQIENGGDFNIQGPKQVFAGIDYPDTHSGAGEMSKDYWAVIYKDGDAWAGYANGDIRDTHGEGADWGELHREGACYLGKDVKICLWR